MSGSINWQSFGEGFTVCDGYRIAVSIASGSLGQHNLLQLKFLNRKFWFVAGKLSVLVRLLETSRERPKSGHVQGTKVLDNILRLVPVFSLKVQNFYSAKKSTVGIDKWVLLLSIIQTHLRGTLWSNKNFF